MKLLALIAAVSLALAAGCDRNTSTTPSPKADSRSSVPSAVAGSSTTPSGTTSSSAGGGSAASAAEKREGSNPQQGHADPKSADQHRDFRQSGDQAGPQSSDTAPTGK